MADLIKKIKIKKQDGTFTDYIPIGAEAQNVSTSDGDSVQLKLNKKPYYYNSVVDMKADTKLKAGDMAVTLGYYEVNDGGNGEYRIVSGTYTDDGGSYHELNNNLYAELIIKNNEFNIAQFGAKANTDCKDIVQICIDFSANHGYKMIIPEGKTYLVYSLTLTPGVQIDGQGAIFKKPNLSAPPYNMTPAQMKWVRMFSSGGSDLTTESSKLVEFKNLTLDGNALEMWDPSQGYAQEQASLMILGKKSSTESARWKINIDNCIFKNNVSDGIHVWVNTEVNITNCRSENCFRGGLVVTGGNSIINANNFACVSTVEGMPDGIDIEVDSKGALDLKRIYVNLKNFIIDTDFDIGTPGDGGYIYIENTQLLHKGFIVSSSGVGGIQSFTNCYFHGEGDATWQVRFVSPKDIKVIFNNCIFNGTVQEDEETHQLSSNQFVNVVSIYEGDDYTIPHSQCIFNSCKFLNMRTVSGTLSHLVDLVFENCDFTDSIVGSSAIGQWLDSVAFAPNTLTLNNNRFYNSGKWLQCSCSYEPVTQIFLSNNKILNSDNQGVWFHKPIVYFNNDIYDKGYQIAVSNGGNPQYRGRRIIVGDELVQQNVSQNIRFINEIDEFQLNDHSQSYYRHNNQWIEKFPNS